MIYTVRYNNETAMLFNNGNPNPIPIPNPNTNHYLIINNEFLQCSKYLSLQFTTDLVSRPAALVQLNFIVDRNDTGKRYVLC